jgi:hypothetical protein
MTRSIFVAIAIVMITAWGASAQPRRTAKRPPPKPKEAEAKAALPPKPEASDPISGEWNGVYQYRDIRKPFKMNLKLDGQLVSGEVIYDYATRQITEGNWSGGQFNITVANSDDPARPDRMTAMLVSNRLVGSRGSGDETTWEAERFSDQLKRVVANQPPDHAAKLKLELEKLLSLKLSLQMEGAYNLGEMREKSAPAVPFLIDVLSHSGGVKEVDASALKFLESDSVGIVSGSTFMTVYPVQNVASKALGKIGEPAIDLIQSSVLKNDPTKSAFSFGVDALARMQNPKATKLIHALARSDNVQTRRQIIESLSLNKDPASIDLLIESLTDTVSVIRSSAADSLRRITGKDFGADVGKWNEWWATNKPKG